MWQADLAIDASRSDSAMLTGTEWYSREIIRALAAIEDRPSLTLYHRSKRATRLSAPRVRHRLVRMPRLWTQVGLSAAMLRDRPQALFVPSHVIPLVHPASVVTIHDLGFLHEPSAHPRQQRLMLDATTRWNARVARRVVAVSSQTKADLVQHYEVPSDRITVVHSGVDSERFRQLDPTAVLQQFGITRPYLLFLSTVQPRKNVVRLIEAFEALGERDLNLVIAGRSGWLADQIERRVAGSDVGSRIWRMGYVANEAIPALYNGAAAFVLPSLYEGFGMGVLEAMACGCPVVTSNRSSLPEVAGDAAVLIDPYNVESLRDGIRRVLDPNVREALVAAGLRRAATFTWQRAAQETLTVIDEAVRDTA
jgi:glycosyltransferase involved in cell wall biosynthesis